MEPDRELGAVFENDKGLHNLLEPLPERDISPEPAADQYWSELITSPKARVDKAW
jgi:hypothetical protein